MSDEIQRQDHPSKRRWQAEEVRLLGQEPDASIARKLGIAICTVAVERQRRSITPYRKAIVWTKEALDLLGTDSDQRIGELLGISGGVVGEKRRQLGIESRFPAGVSRSRRPDPFWTPQRDALLGTASDARIARRLGIPYYQVRERRHRLGIPAACPIPRHDWTEVDPLLGREPDASLATRFGIHPGTVRRRRLKLKIAAYQPERRTIRRNAALRRLLTRPTAEITEVSSSAVVALRRELDIEPPPRRSRWTPEVVRRLGEEPDEVIARELGISPETVRRKRYASGRARRVCRRWTAAEMALLGREPDDRKAALRLGRTVKAVRHRRAGLRHNQEPASAAGTGGRRSA